MLLLLFLLLSYLKQLKSMIISLTHYSEIYQEIIFLITIYYSNYFSMYVVTRIKYIIPPVDFIFDILNGPV